MFNSDTVNPVTKMNSIEKQQEAAVKTIQTIDADVEVYSDGSALQNTNGGAGAIIKLRGKDEEYEVKCAAGAITSSYRTEIFAIRLSLQKVEHLLQTNQFNTLAVFTDSKSAVQHLQNCRKHNDIILNDIQKSLANLSDKGIKITIQWIPGHCNVEGNDKADSIAKSATNMPQEEVEIDFVNFLRFIGL